jgi:hypothetical protein
VGDTTIDSPDEYSPASVVLDVRDATGTVVADGVGYSA